MDDMKQILQNVQGHVLDLGNGQRMTVQEVGDLKDAVGNLNNAVGDSRTASIMWVSGWTGYTTAWRRAMPPPWLWRARSPVWSRSSQR